MKSLIVTIFFMMLLAQSCAQKPRSNDLGIQAFDISPDDHSIIVVLKMDSSSALYRINLFDNSVEYLIGGEKGTYFNYPRYSNNNSVLFTRRRTSEFGSTVLCMADSTCQKVVEILSVQGFITDAIFSDNGENIIFSMAKDFRNYSPLAGPSAHNFDIYSCNLASKKLTKITNFNAYEINSITVKDSCQMLFSMQNDSAGMYSLSICKPPLIEYLQPKNNPRKDGSLYYTPAFSHTSNSLFFTAPYELYMMNWNTKIARLIYRSNSSNLLSIKVFHRKDEIAFTKQWDNFTIYVADTQSKLRKIALDPKAFQKVP
jgi:Tol biopolymer transport system component